MPRTVGIGIQDFGKIIEQNCFYIDKTSFIKEWWNNYDDVTLITRPRRFGKTLTLSMVERFFSNQYDDQEQLFGNLAIWQDEEMRKLAGQFPVISLSFADVKENDYEGVVTRICELLSVSYRNSQFLSQNSSFTEVEKDILFEYSRNISSKKAAIALKELCRLYEKHFQKKVILLLDEYDTPMQEAWIGGYWDELVSFTRNLFNAAFKTNPSLGRALMTGITRVSRESLFSDLNNLRISTVTSRQYEDTFGFTEQEVFAAMDEYGYTNKEEVKFWYDGFRFGDISDIYNPWSIINYLKDDRLAPYWANTSSNSLAGKLIREGNADLKTVFEDLLSGKTVTARIKEEIVFGELTGKMDSVLSLLMAAGYLKPVSVDGKNYMLALTNYEVLETFEDMVRLWFEDADIGYNEFVQALLEDDLDYMNDYMNEIALCSFSSFDSGTGPSSKRAPENFYHGFVLGLMIGLKDRFIITSNRESGMGRYDVVIEPRNPAVDNAFIIEFKVHNPRREADLEATVDAALQQIEDKQYAANLIARGIPADRIRSYGFAFRGKVVLIGGQ